MAELSLRPALSEDTPSLERLLGACGLSDTGLSAVLSDVRVAELDREIVGMAGLERYAGAVLVRSVAVLAPFRSQGIGEKLTLAVLDVARGAGVQRAYLMTDTAERFFAGLGFERVPRAAVPADILASPLVQAACTDVCVCMESRL